MEQLWQTPIIVKISPWVFKYPKKIDNVICLCTYKMWKQFEEKPIFLLFILKKFSTEKLIWIEQRELLMRLFKHESLTALWCGVKVLCSYNNRSGSNLLRIRLWTVFESVEAGLLQNFVMFVWCSVYGPNFNAMCCKWERRSHICRLRGMAKFKAATT